MRLLLIRHADPDYSIDSLTPSGWKEAEALAEFSPKLHIDTCYVSPLGRARDTASLTLKKLGKTAETRDWLEEFPALVDVENSEHLKEAFSTQHMTADGKYAKRIVWDMYPSYYAAHPEYWDEKKWRETEVARMSDLVPVYDRVVSSFDGLLAEHGYERDGRLYRAVRPSHETVALFCHFGVSCAMMSHLMNVSPFVLWHMLCLQPSSFTELITEERQDGRAVFRALQIGSVAHLAEAGLTPSFAARFCETFADDTRH
ncbi:MAG: histidine phosphatase family protein [Lachnospiraceae bacterium]